MKTAQLGILGPSTLVLAQYLQQNEEWMIDRIEQTTSMRGVIVGRHEDPENYIGFGISDGTRIQTTTLIEELYETENTE